MKNALISDFYVEYTLNGTQRLTRVGKKLACDGYLSVCKAQECFGHWIVAL